MDELTKALTVELGKAELTGLLDSARHTTFSVVRMLSPSLTT